MNRTESERIDEEAGIRLNFSNMNKPIPAENRQAAEVHCAGDEQKTSDTPELIARIAERLEEGSPLAALKSGQKTLGVMGTYAVIAILLGCSRERSIA